MNTNLEHDMEDSSLPSRTKRKEQVEELQYLGIELTKLSKEKIKKLDLPENLREAIKEAQRLTANGAVRRQNQYIGKLMRNVDAENIRQQLNYLNGDSIKSTQILHLAEKWRDQLLDSDSSLNQFIENYSDFDIGELRSLIRAVRKERELQVNRNFTKLFRFIKIVIEEHNK